MLLFPNAKINIGLNITRRLKSGLHAIESCFCPVEIHDVIEVKKSNSSNLIETGIPITCKEKDNLILKVLHEIKIKDQQHWNIIEKSMIKVIQSWNGTAHNLYTEGGVVIAGKTGTAQIKSLTDQDLTVREEYQEVRDNIEDRDHALFASYGPIPNPNIAVVVIVENGESGSAVAAPIAKKMIEAYQKITFIDEQ